ncbi:Actin-histidine N-methyltransferase [Picochlorum sp. SENEW3]|nr:Actin-histidine N-methyltransferase [Picochlorum sp. SENEW3]
MSAIQQHASSPDVQILVRIGPFTEDKTHLLKELGIPYREDDSNSDQKNEHATADAGSSYYYDYDASGRQDGVDVDVDARKEDADEEKKRVLQAARVFCLTKDEVYFLESASELRRPLNHRNEAAALSLIQHCIHSSMGEDAEREHGLLALLEYVNGLCAESVWNELNTGELNSFGNRDIVSCIHASSSEMEGDSSTAPRQASREAFLAWALKDNRIESRVIPAECEGGIQGCVAMDDIHIGEDVLKIPVDVLLYDETVLKTDVGAMLSVIPDVSIDNILIIFTMIDRFDDDSAWKPFWNELPDAFKTGISFHESVLNLLEGSAAFNEIQKAQKHIRDQYDACAPLFDALVTAYPKYLTRDMFTYDRYVWAVELWYSYAFEIEFPPHTMSKTVMVPFACLVNHSPWPHVVRYGRVDQKEGVLKYPAFRPVNQGEQAFISYGAVPNLKLITYYGFSIADNPHDILSLTLEIPSYREEVEQALQRIGVTLDHNLRHGPLSSKLKACLRIIVSTPDELECIKRGDIDPLVGPIGQDNEKHAMEMALTALQGILEPLQGAMRRFDEALSKVPLQWRMSAAF